MQSMGKILYVLRFLLFQELPEIAKMYIVSKKVEGFSKQTLYNYKKYLEIFFFALQKSSGADHHK